LKVSLKTLKQFGPFSLDPGKRRLWRDGTVVPLTPKAIETLLALVSRPGEVIEKEELLKLVWPDTFVEEATLAQNISTLRKALGDTSETPVFIATIPRRGYRFVADVLDVPDAPVPIPVRALLPRAASAAASPRVWLVFLVGALVGSSVPFLVGLRRAVVSSPVVFSIPPPDGERFSNSGSFMAVSPNGKHIAFVASDRSGRDQLWLRPLDAPNARMLPGTGGAFQPFWSADSQSIGFFADGKLKRTDIASGRVSTIADCGQGCNPLAGTWNDRNDILFASAHGDIVRVAASGGTPAAAIPRARDDDAIEWPSFLPDGRHFLFLIDSSRAGRTGIYVGSLDSAERIQVSTARSSAVYTPSGHLWFVQGGTLVRQGFDVSTFRTRGAPVPVAEHVAFNIGTARGTFSISQTGLVAYRTAALHQLTWVSRTGEPLDRVGTPGTYDRFTVAPDGTRVATARVDAQSGISHLWLVDGAKGAERRLTFSDRWEIRPIWSRNGQRVAFSSNRNGKWEIFEHDTDGIGADRMLLSSTTSVCPEDWSPDGRLLFQETGPESTGDFRLLKPGSDGRAELLPNLESEEGAGRVSPDGKWIAYRGYQSGWFIFVRPLHAARARWQVSGPVDQWAEPRWRGDGRELFYLAPDLAMMAVDISTDPAFRSGNPHRLFQAPVVAPSGQAGQSYDVAPDGERFLLKVAASVPALTVVANATTAR